MNASPKQITQRREMNAQTFGPRPTARQQPTARRKAPFITPKPAPQSTAGHANLGTDADVRAYCARMGYVYDTTTKKKENHK